MADSRQDEILKKYGRLMENRQTEVAPSFIS